MAARILIVDDEPDIVFMVRVILRSAGYEVVEASSVAEARGVLAREIPDLVLLDLRLSDGEGWEILETIRADARLGEIPVVIVSAHTTPSTAVRAREEGAVAYITKPFAAGKLVSVVERHLEAG